ncbi:MAG TPA: hypothetical protein VL177_09955 [Terriglobales bacterium]|jgi:hypothetical protein|nr:hypothetical protein [Terriglobales bacterium]
MGAEATDQAGRKTYIWGLLLAWAPAIPLIIGMSRIFRGISENKATGIGAVAGGLAEAYLIFGLVATLAFQVGGIVLLSRSFSPGHGARAVFSALSIGWSILTLVLLGLFLWLYFALPHH